MKKLLLLLLLLIPIMHCGPQGSPYIQGPPGEQGPGGYSCTTSTIAPGTPLPLGGAMISCPDGTTSLISNGTIITPIQFCPGTPSYPSTFVEYGFCINSQLWAVYSLNNGFMTLIPPGEYYSNAVGSNCNFQVVMNCGIINN